MPLEPGKSAATRSRNIATEINAGKPAAQAEAIAYRMQRAKFGDVIGIHPVSKLPVLRSIHGAIEVHPHGLNDEQHAQYRAFADGGVTDDPPPTDPVDTTPQDAPQMNATAQLASGQPASQAWRNFEQDYQNTPQGAPDYPETSAGPTMSRLYENPDATEMQAGPDSAGGAGIAGLPGVGEGLQTMAMAVAPGNPEPYISDTRVVRPSDVEPGPSQMEEKPANAGIGLSQQELEDSRSANQRGAQMPVGGATLSWDDKHQYERPPEDVDNEPAVGEYGHLAVNHGQISKAPDGGYQIVGARGEMQPIDDSMVTDEQKHALEVAPIATAAVAAKPTAVAGNYGPTTDYQKEVARLESAGGKLLKNPNPGSTSHGLYGFTKSTADRIDRKYGLDPSDQDIENKRLNALTRENASALNTTDPLKLYGAHNSGAMAVKRALEDTMAAGEPEANWIEHLLTPTGRGNNDPLQGRKALKRSKWYKPPQLASAATAPTKAKDGAVVGDQPEENPPAPDPVQVMDFDPAGTGQGTTITSHAGDIGPEGQQTPGFTTTAPSVPEDTTSADLEAEAKAAGAIADDAPPDAPPDEPVAQLPVGPTPAEQLDALVGGNQAASQEGTEQIEQGAQATADAKTALSAGLEPIYQNAARAYAASQERMQAASRQAQYDAQAASAQYHQQLDRLQSMKVDPSAYWSHQDGWHQALGFLGIALSGLSGSDHNAALDGINKSIDRDIESQKFNIGTQKSVAEGYNNLYDMALKTFKIPEAAEAATRAGLLNQTANEADAMGAHYGGQLAQGSAQTAIGTALRAQAEANMQIAQQTYQNESLRRAGVRDILLQSGGAKLYGGGGAPALSDAERTAITRNAIEQGNYLPSPSGDIITKRKPTEKELEQGRQIDQAEYELNRLRDLAAHGSKLSPTDKASAKEAAETLGSTLNIALGLPGGVIGQRTEDVYTRAFTTSPLDMNPFARDKFEGQRKQAMEQLAMARSRLGGGALFGQQQTSGVPIYNWKGNARPKRPER